MADGDLININDIPCCPEITREPCCERLQVTYTLQNRVRDDVTVEVSIVAELERCPGPLALGDVVYSTTLLPGERVRLNTSSRNTRFTYDAESEVSYRHEQSSEETYYMSSMDRFMSDLSVRDSASGGQQSESDFEVNTSGSYASIGFAGGGKVNVEGDFSAESSFDFLREVSRHAESSHERSVQATRAVNAVQVGEVQSRSHAEGESESAYEASTRVFENRNQCHAVTYFAYQLVKKQTIRFRIKAVLRRVIDPAGNAVADARPIRPPTGVRVLPNGILATAATRVEVETAGRTGAAAQQANLIGGIAGISDIVGLRSQPLFARRAGSCLRDTEAGPARRPRGGAQGGRRGPRAHGHPRQGRRRRVAEAAGRARLRAHHLPPDPGDHGQGLPRPLQRLRGAAPEGDRARPRAQGAREPAAPAPDRAARQGAGIPLLPGRRDRGAGRGLSPLPGRAPRAGARAASPPPPGRSG
jgi:hypothetical protein